MRLILLGTLAVALAACSTDEGRTDRRSGSGLTQGSLGATGKHSPEEGRVTEVAMTAPDQVPQFNITAPGATGDRSAAAELAAGYDADPMGVGVTLGGELYWLRQVRANSIEFAVAEPQTDAGAVGGVSALTDYASTRIGCLLTGETWTFDGVLVAGLNCS